MASNPYSSLPAASFWRRAISELSAGDVDPVFPEPPFHIATTDAVVTAGSCFAQHIARYLRQSGFNQLVTEPAHPIAPKEIAEAYNYGVFSARYGNIYTARQLLQLLDRAYGRFQPLEDMWFENGRYIDPFRPRIQPGGFASREEFDADRRQHFAAVRRAFEELDVLIFTLGLTEAWRSREDGAVFPLCPGVAGGEFQEPRHAFHNFSVEEVTADMLRVIDFVRDVNPKARLILTVSPVPLAATAEPRHVLVSTVYSKSVLRLACDAICAARPQVVYFPSYEIVTGPFSRGAYFGPDCRSVTETGVEHVMGVFFRHFTNSEGPVRRLEPPRGVANPHLARSEELVTVLCDEEMLDSQFDATKGGSRRARHG